MKKRTSILVCMALLFMTGCQNKEMNDNKWNQIDYGDEFVPEVDDQFLNDGMRATVVTDKGYYILTEGYLQFYDKETGKLVPLCGRIDCSHDSDECNAKIDDKGMLIGDICQYKGWIYFIYQSFDGDFILERISTDGSKREEVENLFKSKGEEPGVHLMAHRGCLYFVLEWYKGDREKHPAELYRKDLEGESRAKKVFEYNGYVVLFALLQGWRNEVTFTCDEIVDMDEPLEYRYTHYSYNILTGETKKLPAVDDGTVNEVTLLTRDAEASYYSHLDHGLVKVTEEGNQNLYIPDIVNHALIYCDGSRFYYDNLLDVEDDNLEARRRIWIVDKEGKEKVVMSEEDGLEGRFMGGDGDTVFTYVRAENRMQVWDVSRWGQGVVSHEDIPLATGGVKGESE